MIKFKLLSDRARLPTRANPLDAGMDLYTPLFERIEPGEITQINLWIASEFPSGYFCMIKDRSSLAAKGIHVLGGVIDPDYRGPWKVVLINLSQDRHRLEAGDRIAQALLLPVVSYSIIQASSLSETERGEKGFGSTGK